MTKMTRQIEFRVWDKVRNKYVDSELFGSFVYIALGFKGSDLCVPKSDLVIEQFTGLHDKNNKKIFEGDIINYTEKLHEHGDKQTFTACIGYYKEMAAFGIFKNGVMWNLFSDYGISDIEVIGNINENINLLK
jgi:hypothetical protein